VTSRPPAFLPQIPQAFTEFLGFRWEGTDTLYVKIGPHLLGATGRFLGPVAFAMVDYGMGSAVWPHLEADEIVATTHIAINYIASASEGEVVCRSRLDRRTRQNAALRSDIYHDGGDLLATAIGTFAILRRKATEGSGA
jgi:acyl-CoA thioesterase